MGLDVFVIPMWKYFAGDFTTQSQRLAAELGVPHGVASPGSVTMRDPKKKPGFEIRLEARQMVRRIQAKIRFQIGHPAAWNDEGDAVYCAQALVRFEGVRAYARWLDVRDQMPVFEPPPEGDYYLHPVFSLQPSGQPNYPQLVDHDCYCGYFVPAELERVIYLPEKHRSIPDFARAVGSSVRLLSELRQLSEVLGVGLEYTWSQDDPLREIKHAFAQLYTVATLSCTHRLPIIFWG
jgi:hypothetical protein